jgi:hypothetical protein
MDGEQRLQSPARRALQARQEDLIMLSKTLSKTLFTALVAITIGSGACTSTAPGGAPSASEHTGNARSPQVATMACTPLVTPQAPLISCGATAAAQVSFASSVQATLATQMQSAFATLVLTPSFAANQVAITSQAAEFSTFFGTQIVAPLTAGGVFSVAVPLSLGTLAPNVSLVANVFGAVPFVTTPFATSTSTFLGPDPITAFNNANASFSSFNTAAFNTAATNTAALNTAAVNAASMPMTILITSPLTATTPLVCSGAVSLGCL